MKMPWTALRERGIVGMNERNGRYIARLNPRRLYPLVDDKLRTKTLALQHGQAVPELYGTIETERQNRELAALVENHTRFVLKPAAGAGGDGIVVVHGRTGGEFVRSSGRRMSVGDLRHHVSNILSGLYSLGGQPDRAFIEYCVTPHESFERVAYQGVPDIRVIVCRGVPVAAMVRLPTRGSDGKANLHQGAVGAGIDLDTGMTTGAVCGDSKIEHHPDTGEGLKGFPIPDWDAVLPLAARCHEFAPLGYLGVDIVIDADRGPLLLELNARPGLSIQLANRHGLRPLLRAVEGLARIPTGAAERAALGARLAATLS